MRISDTKSVIIVGFSVVLLLLTLVTVFSHYRIDRFYQTIRQSFQLENNVSAIITELRDISRQRGVLLTSAVEEADPFERDEMIQQYRALAREFLKQRDKLLSYDLTEAQRALFTRTQQTVGNLARVQNQAVTYLEEGNFDEVKRLWVEYIGPQKIQAQRMYDDLERGIKREMDQVLAAADKQQRSINLVNTGMISLTILLAVWIASLVYRKILQSERELNEINNSLEDKVAARTGELERTNRQLQQNLTELGLMQEQLVQSEKLASLGGLVAGISHEINTPIGIGVTLTSSLREEMDRLLQLHQTKQMKRSDLEAFLRHADESTDIMRRNLQHAAALVRSFKQVAVDQSSEESRVIDLREYLEEVLQSLHPKLKHRAVEVALEVAGKISLDTYPGAIYQILSNFVLNSLNHGFTEGQSGSIHIHAERVQDRIHLRYSDDGGGISDTDKRRVFEPFFTTRRGKGGSGLGLSIVYNLITGTLKGTVKLEDNSPRGVRFLVSFPVVRG